MSVERYVEICAPLKPAFIHNDKTKELLKNVVEDFGCDLEQTFLDVPRLRMVTSDGYLTSGVGYAHHPHRDTWYSAPMAQLNWWLPIYDIVTEQSMAFHPHYFDTPIKNGSADFNYYEWNADRPQGRRQPDQEGHAQAAQARGGAASSSRSCASSRPPAASCSSRPRTCTRRWPTLPARRATASTSAPSTSRTSRTAVAAPNLDSHCTGTSLRDFIRGRDRAPMPDDVVARYDDESSPPARRAWSSRRQLNQGDAA